MTEKQIENIVKTIVELAVNPNKSSGNVTKIDFENKVQITVTNEEQSSVLRSMKVDNIDNVVSIMKSLRSDEEITVENVVKQFNLDLESPLFLNVF